MARKKCKQSPCTEICKTTQLVAKRHYCRHFSLMMSSSFWYQFFVAVFGKLGGKAVVVDDVLSLHEQELYPTTSPDENGIVFEFSEKLKLARCRGCRTYVSKEVKKEHKQKAKADEETAATMKDHDILVALVTHVYSFFALPFFPMLKCTSTISKYIIQLDCMRTSVLRFQPTSREPSLNTREFCIAKGRTMKILLTTFREAALSEHFIKSRRKMLSRLDGFMLYGKLGADFFSASAMLYRNIKKRLRLFGARRNFYMNSDNLNVSLGIDDWSLYTRCISLKDQYQKKRRKNGPVEFNYLKILSKILSIPLDETTPSKKTFLTMLQYVALLLQ